MMKKLKAIALNLLLLLSFSAAELSAKTVVSTVAGTVRAGFRDGMPSTLRRPEGLSLGAQGQIYFADRSNNKIRVLNTDGMVATIAGDNGSFADGSLATAKFNRPQDLAIDADGNLIITDANNHKIRKIDFNAGTVSTIAGSTQGYSDNADPLLAQFNNPHGICIDSSGNIYVADYNNRKIRKIDGNTSEVTTVAGSSQGYLDHIDPLQARFKKPIDINLNSSETALFVAEDGNRRVRRVDLITGEVTTYAGSGNGYVDHIDPLQAKFKAINSIYVDSNDDIYLTEHGGHKIRKIDGTTGEVTTVAGASEIAGFLDGDIEHAVFRNPSGIVKGLDGNLYVASRNNHTIRKIHEEEKETVTVIVPGTTAPQNNSPSIVLVDDLSEQANAAGEIQIVPEQNITLKAIAFDVEDGSDINNSIVWFSDLEGDVATGQNLATNSLGLGKHNITVSAKDSQGVKDEASLVLNIAASVDGLDLDDDTKDAIRDEVDRIINLSNLDGEVNVEIVDVNETKKRRKKFKKKGLVRAFGWNFNSDSTSTFSATNISNQIIWNSDKDGNFATGGKIFVKKRLSLGEHTLTASIGNQTASIRVRISKKKGKKVVEQLD